MKCAYSFLSVVVLVIGVSIAAFLVIWVTEDICPDTSLRCEEDGKCISKKRFCNKHKDCQNGSDEAIYRCSDTTGFHETLDRYFGKANSTNSTETKKLEDPKNITSTIGRIKTILKEFPEGCQPFKKSGILCKHRVWTEIPWHKFDRNATVLELNQVLHTDELKFPKQNRTQYPEHVRVFYLENNIISALSDGCFCQFKNVSMLHLQNNSIEDIGPLAFCELDVLTWLNLSSNKLQLRNFRFRGMPELQNLLLQKNKIEEINDHIFRELKSLWILNLKHNKITSISERAFRYNLELTSLHLSYNNIQQFEPLTFTGQKKLLSLYLGFNPFSHLPDNLFVNLQSLESLYLEEILIDVIDVGLFLQIPKLDYVHFKKFQYCKYVPKASRCYPLSDGLSSSEDLLGGKFLRMIVWIFASLAIIGNIGILFARTGPNYRRKREKVPDIFIKNLAASDSLMGIYLLILGIKDIEYRNAYMLHAYQWSTSTLCSGIGVMAMISSEVSLLTLTLMSLERYIVISRPFEQEFRLSKIQARMAVGFFWVFVTILALVPVIHWSGEYSFYGSSGLCFPMHLDEAYAFGWQYTAIIFIGLNSLCLIVIKVSYTLLFLEIRNSRLTHPNAAAVNDVEMAIRLFFTVATGFVCWAPIIGFKISVLVGYELPEKIIPWILVFVLPLNSIINPFLYTFTTGEMRVKLVESFKIFPYHIEEKFEILYLRRETITVKTHDTNGYTEETLDINETVMAAVHNTTKVVVPVPN